MSRILLVDDNEAVSRTLERMLQHMGHQTEIATTGRQALAVQKQNPAEVLLTDIFMPDMDGYELIQKFRREFPSVKVIAMSGGMSHTPDGPFLAVAQKIGAHWLLSKPFTPDELKVVIDKATGQSPDA